jgi:ABC-type phosphate transport system auxiliary subunit
VNKSAQAISGHSVLHDIIPKLKTVDRLVNQTLAGLIETRHDAAQTAHYEKLKAEFQLELTMIRMNLEHLLKRYRHELEAVRNDTHQDVLLTLDAYEATAIENAKQLYRRVQALQTQGVT